MYHRLITTFLYNTVPSFVQFIQNQIDVLEDGIRKSWALVSQSDKEWGEFLSLYFVKYTVSDD